MNWERKGSPELSRPSIFVRGHHLLNLADVVTKYSSSDPPVDDEGKIIALDRLYLYPQQGALYLQSLIDEQTGSQMEGYGEPYLAQKYLLDDYFGENGVRAQQFADGAAAFFQQVFLSDPATVVEVNTRPDAICYSCQISPGSEIGRHCRISSNSDARYIHFMREALEAVSLPYGQLEGDGSISFRAEYIRRGDVIAEMLRAKLKMYSSFLRLAKEYESEVRGEDGNTAHPLDVKNESR